VTLDRQSAAAAERRPADRVINAIAPMRTIAPRAIHSQISDELDPLSCAGELPGWAAGADTVLVRVADGRSVTVAGALALGVRVGLALGVGVGLALGTLTLLVGTLTLLVGERLAIAPPTPLLPHPAARNPSDKIAANRTRVLVKRRMPDPSARRSDQRPLAETSP
jgi:hypothetical protein